MPDNASAAARAFPLFGFKSPCAISVFRFSNARKYTKFPPGAGDVFRPPARRRIVAGKRFGEVWEVWKVWGNHAEKRRRNAGGWNPRPTARWDWRPARFAPRSVEIATGHQRVRSAAPDARKPHPSNERVRQKSRTGSAMDAVVGARTFPHARPKRRRGKGGVVERSGKRVRGIHQFRQVSVV